MVIVDVLVEVAVILEWSFRIIKYLVVSVHVPLKCSTRVTEFTTKVASKVIKDMLVSQVILKLVWRWEGITT